MSAAGFTDAYVWEENGIRYITYRSGMTVYEERFHEGRLCPTSWNHEGFVSQTNTVPATARLNPDQFLAQEAFAVQIDGVDLGYNYDWESFEARKEPDGLHVKLRLKSIRQPIAVTVHTLLDGTRFLTRYLTVENLSGGPLSLSGLTILSGALQDTGVVNARELPYEVGYMHNAQACREGDFHWTTLPRNTLTFGKKLYEERYRTPFFAVRNCRDGNLFLGQLDFSGGYACSFHTTVDCHTMRARLSFEIAIRSTAPLRTLSADECMQTPAVHMAMTPDRFDEAVQELHVHSRRYCGVYSKHRLIESSIGPEVCMSEEMVIHAMDNAAAIGAELFFIDAGWYSPDGGESDWPAFTGDWDPIHWRYQRSMLDFRQYAHDKGMLFGLWMDVEKIGWQSRTMQNPSVPQLQGYAGRTMDAKSGVLDVADPAGAEWAYQQIRSVIERYQLDFFRLDSGAYAYWSQGIVDGRHENRDLRYYEHFYSIFERLRREFPKVIFQNCAGGGSRIDLGMLRPMSNTWVTDNQVAPLSFSVLNGVSLCVPPDYMVRTIGAQGGHMAGTLAFQLNVVRFGIPNYCYVPPVSVDLSPDQLDHVRRMLDTYKTYIRPMLPTSRIYHHTPVLQYEQPGCFGVLELAAEDGSCSLLSAFTLSEVTEPVHTVRFKGLCAHLDYDIWVDDRFWCTLPGSRLMMDGLPVEIPGALDSKAFLAVAHKDDLRPLSI